MEKFDKIIMGNTVIVTAEKELEPQIENLFARLEQVDCDKLIDGFTTLYYLYPLQDLYTNLNLLFQHLQFFVNIFPQVLVHL